MKVLWICNIMLPVIAKQLRKPFSVREGWLSGTLDRFILERNTDIKLGVCFPVSKEMISFQRTMNFSGFPLEAYGFYEDLSQPFLYDENLEKRFQEIYDDFKPDVIHIFGTEFPHTLAATKVCHHPERILIGLQGIISKCAEVYLSGLPQNVVNRVTFRDWLKKDSILQQQKKFMLRGENEKKALAICKNVTGRTDFDKNYAQSLGPSAKYYAMNETMRSCFYEEQWQLPYCRKHRIFFSQADYPLKGFHFMLQALPKLLQHFPDTEIVVAGNSIVNDATLKDKIKLSSYGQYLRSFIDEWELQNKVVFLGSLSAEEMKEQYLLCHTFVCASTLENSPNSVAEAMLLGVPVVAAEVGGIPSMIKHMEEGILFHSMDAESLADAILMLWEDDDLTENIAARGRQRARITHASQSNYNRLMEIYQKIAADEDTI